MSLLLDTHAVLWWLDGSLADDVAAAVAEPTTTVWVSSVSVWEVAIKASIGKLRAPAGLADVIADEGFFPLSITIDHAEAVRHLPFHHRDPFDRLLVAQALADDLTVVTRDAAFAPYGVRVLAC